MKNIYVKNIFYNSYPSGANVWCIQTQHQSQLSGPPAASSVYTWAAFFPAEKTDLGTPDTVRGVIGNSGSSGDPYNGARGGRRMGYITGQNVSGLGASTCVVSSVDHCSELNRRDFTKATVLYRDNANATVTINPLEFDTLSVPISLGSTYYPLLADGTTGTAVTSVQLRADEAAVLLKYPAGTNITFATATTGPGSMTCTLTSGTYVAGTDYSCTATAPVGTAFMGFTDTCGTSTVSGTADSGFLSQNCSVTATFISTGLSERLYFSGVFE